MQKEHTIQKEYTVIWRIQVTGDSPREAAEMAKDIMLDGEALFFEVMTEEEAPPVTGVSVDLNVADSPCEHCRKCGSTGCGNDIYGYSCYEE